MHKTEYVHAALAKIKQTVERVISNSEQITSYKYYYEDTDSNGKGLTVSGGHSMLICTSCVSWIMFLS